VSDLFYLSLVTEKNNGDGPLVPVQALRKTFSGSSVKPNL